MYFVYILAVDEFGEGFEEIIQRVNDSKNVDLSMSVFWEKQTSSLNLQLSEDENEESVVVGEGDEIKMVDLRNEMESQNTDDVSSDVSSEVRSDGQQQQPSVLINNTNMSANSSLTFSSLY